MMIQHEQGNALDSADKLLSPSAPGLPPESGVAVDISQVAPEAEPSPRVMLMIGAATAVGVVALTASLLQHSTALTSADIQLHSWVLSTRTEESIAIARWLTWGGATVVSLPALAVIGACASPRWRPLRSRVGAGMLLAGLASVGVYAGLLINGAVDGARPQVADWAGTAGGPSFPSGHTTAATIFAAFVVWALAPYLRSAAMWAGAVSAAVAYAVIVGLTRIWLGVHWPSDVLGGWLFGITVAALSIAAVSTVRRRGWFTRVSDFRGTG